MIDQRLSRPEAADHLADHLYEWAGKAGTMTFLSGRCVPGGLSIEPEH
jgi:hypothetical protein